MFWVGLITVCLASFGGELSFSPPPVRAPSGLIAEAGANKVYLEWNPNLEKDLAGYRVYRRLDKEKTFHCLTANPIKENEFTDKGLENGVRVEYAVTAVLKNGKESEFSNIADVIVRAIKPPLINEGEALVEELSNVVLEYFKPRIWYWMSHFIKYPERYYAARFPLYYMRKLRALNRADAVQISVVPGWQSREEVEKLKEMGLAVIGEIYITPTPQEQREHARLAWELGCDGFFVGTLENLFDEKGALTPTGKETEEIIKEWKNGGVK